MDESMRIMVVSGVISLLVIVAVYRFVTQRRQLSSGRTIGRFIPQRHDGKFVFENLIIVSASGKWCRLLLTLKSAEAYRIQKSPGYFFEKVALLVGTPYTLTLRNNQNRVVHTETRSLEPFVTWLGSREHTTETMLSEHSSCSHQGTFTLLEFLPRVAGQYHLSLQISEKVEAEYPGSSSTWELLEMELTAMEDVMPLSGTVSYPHQRVRI
jgi:hypothetical protein